MQSSSLNIVPMVLNLGMVGKCILALLLFLSVFSFAIMLQKLSLYARARRENNQFIDLFWTSQSMARSFERTKKYPASPIANIFIMVYRDILRIDKTRYASSSDASLHVERVLRKAANRETANLEKYLTLLATIGSVSPFIGLLGTVWGIMDAFRAIGLRGSATLSIVAPGIAEALINTAAGLFVAIPAVMAYNLFIRRVRFMQTEMEGFLMDFLNLFQRQSYAAKTKETP